MKTFEDLVEFLLEHDCRVHVKQYKTKWITVHIECWCGQVGYVDFVGGVALFSIGGLSRKQVYRNFLNFVRGRTLSADGHTFRVPH